LNLRIDHIVYAFPDLEKGIQHIKDLLKIAPVYGGRHLDFGTHNALVGLGSDSYLEIIAPDPANTTIKPPRWMGVDLLANEGVITRIALKTNNIQADLERIAHFHPKYNQWGKGSRKTTSGKLLSWQMSYPMPSPKIDVIPFLVQWEADFHPADQLQHKIQFVELDIFTQADITMLKELYDSDQVNLFLSETNRIKLHVKRGREEIIMG
jgi:hypothetical protein